MKTFKQGHYCYAAYEQSEIDGDYIKVDGLEYPIELDDTENHAFIVIGEQSYILVEA